MVSTNKCFVPPASSQRWRRFQSTRTSLLSFKRRWLTAQIFSTDFHWLLPLPALIFLFWGVWVQHPDPAEDCQKERVCHGRGRGWGKIYSFNLFIIYLSNKMGQVKRKQHPFYFLKFLVLFICKMSVNWVLIIPSTQQMMLQYSLLPLMFFTLVHAAGRCKCQRCSTRHSLVSFIHHPCCDFC